MVAGTTLVFGTRSAIPGRAIPSFFQFTFDFRSRLMTGWCADRLWQEGRHLSASDA
jgi:hypothetical protein